MKTIVPMLALVFALGSGASADEPIHKSKKSEKARSAVKTNPCVTYGPGFVQLPGTNTCVKVGGSIAVEGRVH